MRYRELEIEVKSTGEEGVEWEEKQDVILRAGKLVWGTP